MEQMKSKEELFNEGQNWVTSTIRRKFNSDRFLEYHGLSRQDLLQYGQIGLWQAVETYDPNKKASFKTHAINNIKNRIMVECKRDSLSNLNNSTLELLDRTSLNDVLFRYIDGTPVTVDEVIVIEGDPFEDAEMSMLIDGLKGKVSDRVVEIVKMRLDDLTYTEIGERLGLSGTRIKAILSANQDNLKQLLLAS